MTTTPKPAAETKAPAAGGTLAELNAFVETLDPAIEYSKLPAALRAAGWLWRLKEREVMPLASGNFLIVYDFMVGKDVNKLTVLDRVTAHLPGNISALSMYGRLSLDTTLVHLVFGRQPPAPPVQAPTNEFAYTDTTAPEAGYPMDEETIEEDEAPVRRGRAEPVPVPRPEVDLISARTPDGIPLFDDLYAVDAGPEQIISALFATLEDELPKITTPEGLQVLWKKNAREFAFVNDFGTGGDKAYLPRLFAVRKDEIDAPASTRRRPAQN